MLLQTDKRQYVSFTFYQIDTAFRCLSAYRKQQAGREFVEAVRAHGDDMLCLAYSLVGLRAEADFMLWIIAYGTDALQRHAAAPNSTIMAGCLNTPHAFLSQTKHSAYVDGREHPGQEGRRLHLDRGTRKYLFVYPFVKTRP